MRCDERHIADIFFLLEFRHSVKTASVFATRLAMPSILWKLLLYGVLLFAAICCFASEMTHPGEPSPISPIRLRPLTIKSGYIFAGTVTNIAGTSSRAGKDVATVRITFHVDRGVRGVHTGQTLAIREWAGLWEYGQRYRVGEKVFLFLYQPSKLGLTSVVGGTQGQFPISRDGHVGIDPVLFPNRPAKPAPQPMPRGRISVPIEDFEHAIRVAERSQP
jgi:hypothetical protein